MPNIFQIARKSNNLGKIIEYSQSTPPPTPTPGSTPTPAPTLKPQGCGKPCYQHGPNGCQGPNTKCGSRKDKWAEQSDATFCGMTNTDAGTPYPYKCGSCSNKGEGCDVQQDCCYAGTKDGKQWACYKQPDGKKICSEPTPPCFQAPVAPAYKETCKHPDSWYSCCLLKVPDTDEKGTKYKYANQYTRLKCIKDDTLSKTVCSCAPGYTLSPQGIDKYDRICKMNPTPAPPTPTPAPTAKSPPTPPTPKPKGCGNPCYQHGPDGCQGPNIKCGVKPRNYNKLSDATYCGRGISDAGLPESRYPYTCGSCRNKGEGGEVNYDCCYKNPEKKDGIQWACNKGPDGKKICSEPTPPPTPAPPTPEPTPAPTSSRRGR